MPTSYTPWPGAPNETWPPYPDDTGPFGGWDWGLPPWDGGGGGAGTQPTPPWNTGGGGDPGTGAPAGEGEDGGFKMDWGKLGERGLSVGLNALAGWLKNRKGARTGEFDRSHVTSGSTTRTRTLRPEQEAGMSLLDKRMRALLEDPAAGLGPMFTGVRASVNRRYAGAPQMLADRMLSHGQKSGKFGRGVRQMEMGRLGDLSALEPEFARMILEQKDKGVGIAERLLGQDFGGTVSTSSTGRQWGTDTRAGSAAGGAVGGGAEALTLLMMLDKMMQGQGAGAGGGG